MANYNARTGIVVNANYDSTTNSNRVEEIDPVQEQNSTPVQAIGVSVSADHVIDVSDRKSLGVQFIPSATASLTVLASAIDTASAYTDISQFGVVEKKTGTAAAAYTAEAYLGIDVSDIKFIKLSVAYTSGTYTLAAYTSY